MLEIEDYDECERAALAMVGNDAIWAFRPAAFAALGYPASIRDPAELVRFVDPMKEDLGRALTQEDEFLRNHSLRTRFTRGEADTLTALRLRVGCRRALCWDSGVTRSPAFREYPVRQRGQLADR